MFLPELFVFLFADQEIFKEIHCKIETDFDKFYVLKTVLYIEPLFERFSL